MICAYFLFNLFLTKREISIDFRGRENKRLFTDHKATLRRNLNRNCDKIFYCALRWITFVLIKGKLMESCTLVINIFYLILQNIPINSNISYIKICDIRNIFKCYSFRYATTMELYTSLEYNKSLFYGTVCT